MQLPFETRKIGIVIPWFGKELKGGAEQQAWQIATRLQNIGCQVTALSTCSQSFLHKWHVNHYKPGHHQEDGIDIIRFPVAKRNPNKFNHVVGKLLSMPSNSFNPGLSPLTKEDERVYWSENINSPELIGYLKEEQKNFDFFIFLPYLFPITIEGILAVPEKALLQACLHDECYAYLSKTLEGVYRCKALLFNSLGELQLAKNIYGEWLSDKSFVIGEGVEHHPVSKSFKPSIPIPKNYILCLGRKCNEKNTPLLIEQFELFCQKHPSSELSLILAGPEKVQVPENQRIIDLGIVEKDLKSYLLAHSKALINPSTNESFSRVIFESWKEGRPIIVHQRCLATYEALKASNLSGWSVKDDEDFIRVFELVDKKSQAEIEQIGKKGQAYAEQISDWDEVMKRYISCFTKLSPLGNDRELNKKQELLVIIPQTKLSEHEQIDLELFLDALYQSPRWNVIVRARNPKALSSMGEASFLQDQSHCLEPELIIWYGEQNWEEGINLIDSKKSPVVRKSLQSQSIEEVRVENNCLFQSKGRYHQSLSCPNLFPLSFVQKESCDEKDFDSINKEGINILLLANLQSPDCSLLFKAFEKIYTEAQIPINLLVPESISGINSLVIENFEGINWHSFTSSKATSIPSHIYLASDCMIVMDPVDLPSWFSLGACAYQLPVLKLNSEKNISQDFFSMSLTDKTIDQVISFLKLATQSETMKDKLNNINLEVIKSHIPGNFQSKLNASLQSFISNHDMPL